MIRSAIDPFPRPGYLSLTSMLFSITSLILSYWSDEE
jgi:hypothetical protein